MGFGVVVAVLWFSGLLAVFTRGGTPTLAATAHGRVDLDAAAVVVASAIVTAVRVVVLLWRDVHRVGAAVALVLAPSDRSRRHAQADGQRCAHVPPRGPQALPVSCLLEADHEQAQPRFERLVVGRDGRTIGRVPGDTRVRIRLLLESAPDGEPAGGEHGHDRGVFRHASLDEELQLRQEACPGLTRRGSPGVKTSAVTPGQQCMTEAPEVVEEPRTPRHVSIRQRLFTVFGECRSGHRCEQVVLALKVPVERGLLHAEASSECPRAHRIQSYLVEQVQCLLDHERTFKLRHIDNLSVIAHTLDVSISDREAESVMSDSTTTPLRVVIAGGGIAGPALAFWLARAGHHVTVVERFPALRATGAQVDLRGQGIEAIRAMGLLDEVRAHLVAEPGVRLTDRRGRTLGTVMANTSGTGRQTLTSEYEIMRGDLVRILFDATKDDVEYRFGLSVDGFEQHPDHVAVRFSDGTTGDFDVLVGADGQGSRIRRAILPSGAEPYRRLGMHMAYWFVPRTADDTDIRDTYAASGARQVMRRSHNAEETQAYFVLRETSEAASAVHRASVEEQQRFWADRFRDAGWQVTRFIDGMTDAPFFYSQEVLQVQTDTWSSGRVVLVGDAAHCASPYSGMGISGGLVGAYVLAGELNATPEDPAAAFRRYDQTLRPFVDEIQAAVKPRVLALAMPHSRLGVSALRVLVRLVCALRLPERIAARRSTDRGGRWALPTYSVLKSLAPPASSLAPIDAAR